MVRKKVTPDVATPRSAKLDGVLHDQHEHLHAQPDAGAEHEQVHRLLPGRRGGVHPDSSTKPTAMIAVPATGKTLYRPVRPTMLPLPIDVMSIPATIGSVRRPDVRRGDAVDELHEGRAGRSAPRASRNRR